MLLIHLRAFDTMLVHRLPGTVNDAVVLWVALPEGKSFISLLWFIKGTAK